MTAIWTGPKVGQPPPTVEDLKKLVAGLISELSYHGIRAARLRQCVRPWTHPHHSDWAPAMPLPIVVETVKESAQSLQKQLHMDLSKIIEMAGLHE